MNRLDGKTALVSGAARGIGAAIARAFADEGAFVYITDIDHDLGARTAAEIGFERAAYRGLDVRIEADWARVVDDILATRGRLDILVNNAGITGFESGNIVHDPENATLESWHEVHRTNLDGVFLGSKHAIRAMRRAGRGAIVNIASRSGVVGIPAAAAYASSKAAVRNHTKSVALYCAEQGLAIRCNAVCPAAILTPMWEPVLGDGPDRAQRMAEFVKDTPLRRFGRPEEVATVAVFLASDESTYITGTEIHVDGGILAGTVAAPQSSTTAS